MATGSMPAIGRTLPSRPSSPHHQEARNLADLESSVGAKDAKGDGKVEPGAFLLDVGGSEVDGDVRWRNQVAGVLDSSADAIAALAHGGVGQPDGVEVVLIGNDTAVVDFDIDQVGVDGCAEGLEEHGSSAASVAG
jgi:hypothetical protein